MAGSGSRRAHAQRQQETRNALVFAALAAFARDGYHAASLEGIANDAGFSKGAIYSNFDGKADLFLAVMDNNLAMVRGDGWDPLNNHSQGEDAADEPQEMDLPALVRGFALATLEFIASAARDEKLVTALRARNQLMIDAYQRIAEEQRAEGETLSAGDVARLMVALNQGISVVALSGISDMDDSLMRVGMRRLLDPAGSAGETSMRTPGGFPGVGDVQNMLRGAAESER